MGCYLEDETNRDFPYQIWARPSDASVTSCIHDCNTRGFDFAGLQVDPIVLVLFLFINFSFLFEACVSKTSSPGRLDKLHLLMGYHPIKVAQLAL